MEKGEAVMASEKVVEEAKERVREGQKLSEEMFEKVRLLASPLLHSSAVHDAIRNYFEKE